MAPDLIPIAAARERVLEAVSPLPTEQVPLADALGRVIAEDVTSAQDLPPFDSSAMDGYAVVAGEGAELELVGESRAGHPAQRALAPGQAIAISTGAQIPEGADAVVPVEQVELRDGRVTVPGVRPGNHVRHAGEDMRAGELVVPAGATLGPSELAVAASVGRDRLACGRRPRVSVLVTGDELVGPGVPLEPGQIRDSNTTALSALAARVGADVLSREVVPDNLDSTTAALAGALERADVVCVSGGVSVGPHDHVKPALLSLGVEERFWGVALKPGKPTWFGTRGDRFVFGLPGNPVSAMVSGGLFVTPAIHRLLGFTHPPQAATARATLTHNLESQTGRDDFVPVRLVSRDGALYAEPVFGKSNQIFILVRGDGLVLVPRDANGLSAGAEVEVGLF